MTDKLFSKVSLVELLFEIAK